MITPLLSNGGSTVYYRIDVAQCDISNFHYELVHDLQVLVQLDAVSDVPHKTDVCIAAHVLTEQLGNPVEMKFEYVLDATDFLLVLNRQFREASSTLHDTMLRRLMGEFEQPQLQDFFVIPSAPSATGFRML